MQTELDDLAEIINRKIFHENIKMYETEALKEGDWKPLVLPVESYSIEKIKNALEKGVDLNTFAFLKGKRCIDVNLNAFLKKVKKAREKKVWEYKELLLHTESINEQIALVDFFCETHIESENIYIKRSFLVNQKYSKEVLIDQVVNQAYDDYINHLTKEEDIEYKL